MSENHEFLLKTRNLSLFLLVSSNAPEAKTVPAIEGSKLSGNMACFSAVYTADGLSHLPQIHAVKFELYPKEDRKCAETLQVKVSL